MQTEREALAERHMYPRLFELGPITVYTYGVLLAAAYLLGLKLAMIRAKTRGLDANRVLDLGIYIIISALIGAKLLLLVTDFRTFRADPRELLTLARSGGVFYGGLILAVVVALWYIRKIGLPLWTTCDVFAPGIALGHVVGRFGCFFAGCCYGRPTTLPWGITFTDPFAAANVGTPLGVPLHPTQLYEAGAELVILLVLLADRNARAGRSPAGRSGSTCCSTRCRASSSSSTAATNAARSACSRPRSSSRCCSRRWRSACWSTCRAPIAPEPKRARKAA